MLKQTFSCLFYPRIQSHFQRALLENWWVSPAVFVEQPDSHSSWQSQVPIRMTWVTLKLLRLS